MSVPPTIPPERAPSQDSEYYLPSILPWDFESHMQFEHACRSRDLANVTELIDSKPRTRQCLIDGLCGAILENNIQIAEFLLNRGTVIHRAVAMAAAHVKSLPIFQLLLEHRWDVNTPVMRAGTVLPNILDNEPLVKWFLEHGAELDPAPRSSNLSLRTTSSVCLNKAGSVSSVAVFDLLLKHGAIKENSTPLHSAAGAGMDGERIPMMAYLIEAGYDVNATDEARKVRLLGTPLHYAIGARSLENAKFLLQRGADPHKSVGMSGSPLEMAKGMGMDEFIGLLE